jgi:hypothetical protein
VTFSSEAASIRMQPALLAACGIGFIAVVWFVLLSGWIGVAPGSVVLARQNVLFNSDTSSWIDEMAHGREPEAKAVHPLEVLIWRPPSRAFSMALRLFMTRERADVLGPRVLVALVAGVGVGSLALVALLSGVHWIQCAVLFAMYLLFSSSVTISLPEHFGLSSGLLSLSFAAPIIFADRRLTTTALAMLTVLCGGTTITNAAYPIAALYNTAVTGLKARRKIEAGLGVALVLAAFLFVDSQRAVVTGHSVLGSRASWIGRMYMKTARVHSHVLDYLNLRLIVRPASAAVYGVYAVIAPAVGPAPVVRVNRGHQMVTYESGQPLRWSRLGIVGFSGVRLRDYSGPSAIGAVAWTMMWCWCLYQATRAPATRRWLWLPLAWLAFNILLHNMWGDELFLYAPHWSWALMAVVILGASRVPRVAVIALVIPIAFGQLYTLSRLKAALAIISQ